ncbi:hypothetical protein MKQ70_08480 [Chitinophaga sedimenti]|uniref:hypothetical protein n=1 Tax=Chitinophaga sedimenti TaxID=2033606 RepID=UPI0020045DFB|nr:hypothetical protein [Chitinophaga sedimenti]MCK7555042.1 hypothetical protein [Chitinophaga sedimenti]
MKKRQFHVPNRLQGSLLSLSPATGVQPRAPLSVSPKEGTLLMMAGANAWGQFAINDPATRSQYEKLGVNGQSIYHLAVADYFKPPGIINISTELYKGRIGDVITITATDNVYVSSVTVDILLPGNQLVEQGSALPAFGDSWTYTAQKANRSLRDAYVLVTVRDLPGNAASATQGILF